MAAAAMLFSSCQKEVEETPAGTPGGATFKASFEQSEAKVYLGDDFYYRWEAGDLVSVFTGDYSHRQYKAVSGDVVESDLEYVSTTTSSSEALSDFNYAVFPYNAANTLKDGVIYSTIAADQTYRKNDLNNAIMVSQIPASSTSFVFRNSCALLKINIKIAEDFANLHSVKSITVTSSAHKLSGPATVAAASGDYTAKIDASAETASNSVTLTGCETAGLLQADEYLTFYIAIPAGTYEADDLTISILTSTTSAPFNVTAKVPAAYTAARSQYIDLSTTLAKDYNWFEQTNEEIIIKEDVVLVDKGIMTYDDNLKLQGFKDQDKIQAIFDVPDHDMTISGWDLVSSGYAQNAENGPTITFQKAQADYIMNTLTTTNSGIYGKEPNKIVLKSLTITGELRTTTMGIYVHNTNANVTGGTTDQAAFNTEWYNVNVINCKIPLYTNWYGGAVCVYGTALLENCKIKGSTPTDDVPVELHESIYDICMTNNVNATIKGGEFGRILTWEHMALTITDNAKVDYINWRMNAYKSSSKLTIENSTIGIIDATNGSTINSLGTRLYLNASSSVDVIKLPVHTSTSEKYTIVIEEGATVGEIIVGDVSYSLAAFKEAFPDYLN